MSSIDELAKKLEADGFGTYGTTIKTMLLPESPDDCICVYASGGIESDDVMGPGPGDFAFERPNFSVIVRNTRADDSYKIAYDIFLKLNNLHGVQLTGGTPSTTSRWEYVRAFNPLQIGPDASARRYMCTVNIRVRKTKSV